MDEKKGSPASRTTWFVGAAYGGGTDDQMPRFLKEGIWESNYDEKLLDVVRAMQPGERIAIKAAYTRKRGLPFDNRGQTVSVMGIKAVGTITENLHDGKRIKVDWAQTEPLVREWYFYTNRGTIWRVLPGDWMNDALIAFAFEGKPQDLDRFRNEPFWRERFGTVPTEKQRFRWTDFYEAVAEKLLDHALDRSALITGIHQIAERVPGLGYLQDKFSDGSSGPLQDICPFTVMGTFNRQMTDNNRKTIAGELAKLLGVNIPVPSSFEGIPILNNQRSWFFGHADKRGVGDIDALWKVFTAASKLEETDQPENRDRFIQAYDTATQVWGVAWNLSTGLYWANPWDFLTLDSQSRHYINKQLRLNFNTSGQQGPCDARSYLKLRDDLRARFVEDSYPVHSFPDLSLAAWMYKDPADEAESDEHLADADSGQALIQEARETFQPTVSIIPYSIDDILKDGCFLDRAEIELQLDRLRSKKNLILQGPPGTGKTWLAKRLAYALMGQKDPNKIRAVQFHPNLSYEDFVRGWRPTGEGKLSLADGVFMEAIKAALKEPSSKFVVVIEEINRGNPAQIFGELLTLLEAGKRTPSEALELCYPDSDGIRRPVHIPENLFVIGTMNIADRSLALVDLALRRRFAFVGLEPRLGKVWREWVTQSCGIDPNLAANIEQRFSALNVHIAADSRLGKQFRIGHSYVTPAHRLETGETTKWFRQVVETEIGPLLEEYWFDAPDEALKATNQLLQGW